MSDRKKLDIKQLVKVPAGRWNTIIRAVNDGDKPESVSPPLKGIELDIYHNCEVELKELRKQYGEKAALSPIESDF